MKALGIYESLPVNDPECFVEFEKDKPVPGPRDLIVKVKAVSVNPVDTKVRRRITGRLVTPKILGWDASGIVEQIGAGVTLFKPGDEVYYAGDITRDGTDSEYHAVDERIAGRKPGSLSFKQAAAMPLTTITAWEALFERLGAPKTAHNSGQSILIIGGAGGVGSIAIQLSKKVAGLKVIATASRKDSAAWCRSLGADIVIDHTKPFREELSRTGEKDVRYILCLNSTESHLKNMADVIKPQGRICTIVETRDRVPVDINIFQQKSVGILWELMFTRPMFQTEDMIEQHRLLNEAADLFDAGVLKPTMTEDFGPLCAESLGKAHSLVESGRMIGKLVLEGFD